MTSRMLLLVALLTPSVGVADEGTQLCKELESFAWLIGDWELNQVPQYKVTDLKIVPHEGGDAISASYSVDWDHRQFACTDVLTWNPKTKQYQMESKLHITFQNGTTKDIKLSLVSRICGFDLAQEAFLAGDKGRLRSFRRI